MYIELENVFQSVSRNLGIKNYDHHIDEWIEWSFEAEKYIGSLDTFRMVEATYTTTGAQATGTLTFAANPSDGDWIELNGTRLYFKDSSSIGGAQASNEIVIGTTLALTLSNGTVGLEQNLSTTVNSNAALFNYPETLNVATYAVDTTAGTLTITYKDIGPEGNNYAISSSSSNVTFSNTTLTGGKHMFRNQQLTLPKNMIKLLAVRAGGNDPQNKHAEFRPTSTTHRSRVGQSDDGTQQRHFRYYVDGNRLNITHDQITEITITYYEYPTDVRGWPMIKDSHITAVAQYIMWQHKLVGYYNAEVPQYIIKDLEKRWYYLCAKARGDDSMPSSDDIKQIGKMWNNLVPIRSGNDLLDF